MDTKHQTTWPTRGLTVAHPASLLPEDRAAFLHAVALARSSGGKLVSVNADGGESDLARIPRAVDALAAWGALAPGADEGELAKLGMSHERVVHSCCDDPVDTLLDALKASEPDLLVATTAARKGAARLLFGSVAEALALHVKAPALLFPVGSRSFVAPETGAMVLRRMLVAAGDAEASAAGAERAAWLADVAGAESVEIVLVHVGSASDAPRWTLPERAGTSYRFRNVEGSPTDAILTEAEGFGADVVVMATRGHDSLGDVLGGSHMERVLHEARCPVLSVPLG